MRTRQLEGSDAARAACIRTLEDTLEALRGGTCTTLSYEASNDSQPLYLYGRFVGHSEPTCLFTKVCVATDGVTVRLEIERER